MGKALGVTFTAYTGFALYNAKELDSAAVFATVPVLDLVGITGLRGNGSTPVQIDEF
jgi:hypothetical protein